VGAAALVNKSAAKMHGTIEDDLGLLVRKELLVAAVGRDETVGGH
jgi:hypothetical protein